jgi:CRP-like cAMP-binding protein
MDFLVYLGQATYLLMLLAFGMRNIAWLRGLAIIASIATIYYSISGNSEPLWIPALWNLAFIAMNVGQLMFARWRARLVTLNPVETFLSKTVLANFPPAEIKSFAQVAGEGDLQHGKQLIRQGSDLAHLFCILQGKVDIKVNGKKHAELTAGYFVGEMCLLTKSKTRADVFAASDLKLLVWPHEDIEKWVSSDPMRLSLLQTALGSQVVDQLLRQNDALISEVKERIAG